MEMLLETRAGVSYGDKNWEPGVSEGLGIGALGLGVLAELMGSPVTRVPCHGDTCLHVTMGLYLCLQNILALLLYFLG